MTLRPMILMVCEECAAGSMSGEWIPGCVICQGQALLQGDEAAQEETGFGPIAARSDEEMIGAAWEAMRNGRTCRAAANDLGMCPDRDEVAAILSAAIPGLLDGES